MPGEFHVYCDESCHIQHDHQRILALGAVWCPAARSYEIARCIRDIKVRHGLPASFEIKWTKVSPAALRFYLDVADFFFDETDLHFRALVVPDKSRLQHEDFGQTHDDRWRFC